MNPNWKKAIIFAAALIGAPIAGAVRYIHQKMNEYDSLLAHYSQALEQRQERIMCAPEAVQLWQWHQENSLLQYYPSPQFVAGIKKNKTISQHNHQFYRQQLQQFYHYLDAQEQARTSLEQQIYSSTDEIYLKVQAQNGNFSLTAKGDPSDHIYTTLFYQLQQDQEVQYFLTQMENGDEASVGELWIRIKDIAAAFPPENKLAEEIYASFPQELDESTILDLMSSSVENIVLQSKLYALQEESVRLAQDNVAMIQKFLPKIATIIAFQRDSQKNGQWQQEKEKYTIMASQYREEIIQTQQRLQTQKEVMEKYRQELAPELWDLLREEFVQFRTRRILQPSELFDTTVLAFGHTHPDFTKNILDDGPSPIDKKASYKKPELVFAALPTQWRIYEAVCGESRLVREYQRIAPKP